jgi:mannose/cellobiose epimerase-like protein (N-acyl-D-glucosamine 2-epimerase family)
MNSAREALQGLIPYLRPDGTWRDKLGADGGFEIEPAPASSLYHLMAAGRQLRETLRI